MPPKKRKPPSTRARSQRVIEQGVLPEKLADLPGRAAAAAGGGGHGEPEVCGACLLPVEADAEIGALDNCTHVFHFSCAARWSQTENSCPQCKVRFFWLAAYSSVGARTSLLRVQAKDQEGQEDDDYEDLQVCERCNDVGDEAALLLCDGMHGTCNAAYHLGCVGLTRVPTGSWFCPDCVERGFDIDPHGRRGNQLQAAPRLAGTPATTAAAASSGGRAAAGAAGGVPAVAASAAGGSAAGDSAAAAADPSASMDVPTAPAAAAAAAAPQAPRAPRAAVAVPPQLRLSALACVSPAVEVPAFQPAAGAAAPAAGPAGVFAAFAQRRRARRAEADEANAGGDSLGGGASFIRLRPTYQEDFMGKRPAA